MSLRNLVAALVGVAAADFIRMDTFGDATCGGSASAVSGVFSTLYSGCSASSSTSSSQLVCTPTGANITFYSGSATCAAASSYGSSALPGITLGTCSGSGAGGYLRYTCQTGTLSPTSVVSLATYSAPAMCNATGPSPSTTSYYTTNSCLNVYGQALMITCQSAAAATVMSYSAAGCSGAGTLINAAALGFNFGCAPSAGGSGVQVISCVAPYTAASGARAGAGVTGAAAAAAGAALLALVARV